MGRANSRATAAPRAERHAADLAGRLGAALRDARNVAGLTQAQAARRAGLAQGTWSALETDRDPRYTLLTWDRAAHAVGTAMSAFLPHASAADQPRDAVHLRHQELVIRTALAGGWKALPEEPIDRQVATSRVVDVLLSRRRAGLPGGHGAPVECCVCEVLDWMADVGGAVRDFSRRIDAVDRQAVARMVGDEAVPQASGFWLVRATKRNRRLVAEHRHFFHARFPGSGRAWLAALTDAAAPMPHQPALLWVSVDGTRMFAARLGLTTS